MNKHTKDIIGVSSSFLVISKAGQIVANCQPTGVGSLDVPFEEAIANALLFAAAPKLLKACKKISKHEDGCKQRGVGYDISVDEIVKAAIAEKGIK